MRIIAVLMVICFVSFVTCCILEMHKSAILQDQNDSLKTANKNLENQLWQERIDCNVVKKMQQSAD